MNPDIVGYVVGALAVTVGGWLTARATVRSNRITIEARQAVEKVKVDGEAYDRAMGINKQITDDLQGEITRLQQQLQELRNQLDRSTQRSDALHRQVMGLQATVNRMRSLLIEHNIPIPQEAV